MTEVTLRAESVRRLLRARYGLRAARIEPVGAEAATVCRVTTDTGDRLAVKVMAGDAEISRWHGSIMARLGDLGLPVPRVVPDLSGAVTPQAGDVHMQVTTWLDGQPYAEVTMDPGLLTDIGRTAARVRLAMSGLELSGLAKPPVPVTHQWELSRSAASVAAALESVSDRRTVSVARAALARFSREVAPHLAELPRGVVHHDLHDSNLLTSCDPAGRRYVSGILDFGDTVPGPRVAELAVAAAYAARPCADPAGALLTVVSGWAAAGAELTALEGAVLYPAAIARLAVNLAVWAARAGGPRGDYARTRASGSLDALDRMLAVPTGEVARAITIITHSDLT